MHFHCLHWLMPTGLLFQSAFCRPYKPTTSETAPKEGSNVAVGTWYGSHSVHVCLGLILEYSSYVGTCTSHSYSTLYSLCHLASLFKLLPPPTPPLFPSSPPSYIRWPNVNEFHGKNRQKLGKISHYLLARQKLIDNLLAKCELGQFSLRQ